MIRISLSFFPLKKLEHFPKETNIRILQTAQIKTHSQQKKKMIVLLLLVCLSLGSMADAKKCLYDKECEQDEFCYLIKPGEISLITIMSPDGRCMPMPVIGLSAKGGGVGTSSILKKKNKKEEEDDDEDDETESKTCDPKLNDCKPTEYCAYSSKNGLYKCSDRKCGGSLCIKNKQCLSNKCRVFWCTSTPELLKYKCQD